MKGGGGWMTGVNNWWSGTEPAETEQTETKKGSPMNTGLPFLHQLTFYSLRMETLSACRPLSASTTLKRTS